MWSSNSFLILTLCLFFSLFLASAEQCQEHPYLKAPLTSGGYHSSDPGPWCGTWIHVAPKDSFIQQEKRLQEERLVYGENKIHAKNPSSTIYGEERKDLM